MLWSEGVMSRYVLGFLCVWYSVSVFSKTEIIFGQLSPLIGAVLSKQTVPQILLSLEAKD